MFYPEQLFTTTSVAAYIPPVSTVSTGGILVLAADSDEVKEAGHEMIAIGSVLAAVASGVVLTTVLNNQVIALEQEVRNGEGPLIESLATALGVSSSRVAAILAQEREGQMLRDDAPEVQVLMVRLLIELREEVRPSTSDVGELLWRLAHEQRADDFPTDARAHRTIANLLHLSVNEVSTAVWTALQPFATRTQMAGDSESMRALIHLEAPGIFQTLSHELEILLASPRPERVGVESNSSR